MTENQPAYTYHALRQPTWYALAKPFRIRIAFNQQCTERTARGNFIVGIVVGYEGLRSECRIHSMVMGLKLCWWKLCIEADDN